MKTGFFEEAPGIKSWMRLAGSYLLILAGFIILYNILKGEKIDFVLITFLVGTAFTGKVAQKIVESKSSIADPPDTPGPGGGKK